MATEEELEKEEGTEEGAEALEGGEVPKKKGKGLLIIVILLVLGLGAGAYFMFFTGEPPSKAELKELRDTARAEVVESGKRGQRLRLEPMAANLGGREGFVRVQLQIELWDLEVKPEHTEMQTEIRDQLLTLLSEKSADELLQPGSRTVLKEEIVTRLNEYFGEDEPVREVFFQEFMVQ